METTEVFTDLELSRDFEILQRRAEDIGMRINTKKMQLLVISPPNGCKTSAVIGPENWTTLSVDSMRLVSYTFGDKPGAGAHVDEIANKYRRKKWMLYHLRDSGFKGKQLFRLYCCYIWSIIEYCSVVYHALLTKNQEVHLERLQRHAVRLCFGHDAPVEDIMAREAIET